MRVCPYASLALFSCVLAVSQGCGGCSPQPQNGPEQTATATQPEAGASDELDSPFGTEPFLPLVWFQAEGVPDVLNRYPFVVTVEPREPPREGGLRSCSGAIIAPRLVLTAGHCVCRQHQDTPSEDALEYRVTGASCADTAAVEIFFYEEDSRMPRGLASYVTGRYMGQVRPHPGLELRLNAHGAVLSSHADLALILMEAPFPAGFRPVRISSTGVALEEALVIAGFGYDEENGGLDDVRLINTRKAAAAMDERQERFRLVGHEQRFFRGGSGGPCLRETPRGPELVGISTTGLGHEPTLTTLLPYREWLLREIQHPHASPVNGVRP